MLKYFLLVYKLRFLEVVWGYNEEVWNFILEQGELKFYFLKNLKN